MTHLFLAAALSGFLFAADASLEAGTQLSYRGTVAPATDDAENGSKSFDLTVWIMASSGAGTDVFWLLDERGRGQFPWPARFGQLALDGQLRTAADGPALLYDRGEGQSVVPLLFPLFVADKPLAAGIDFQRGDLEFHVPKATEHAGRPAWQLDVRNRFGPKRTLLVEQGTPLVLAMREKVIMGRGEEYRLTLDLVTREEMSQDQLATLAGAIERLTGLRDQLGVAARGRQIDWKPEQLKTLSQQLPQLAQASTGTGLSKLAQAAQRDLALQSGRSDALADMQGRFVGSAAPEFAVNGLGSDHLAQRDLKGEVTVLHFWDYRAEPLREPYGQVGYLDFLYQRHQPNGLRLYGVAVNGRLADEATRGSAQRSVSKLKSFMNLSYPILLDGGSLLKRFGDPRVVGGNLPLFIVIGPDSKIIHYHVGHYDVNQDQGLKELDDVVQTALGMK